MIELSIVLPICNEEKTIESFIYNICNLLRKQKIIFEIIAVENGSHDNSFKILETISEKNKFVRVLQCEKGWGNAVRYGILNSKGKYICYMVSDGQINPQYILSLYQEIKRINTGMIKLYRGNRENVMRLLISKVYNFLARVLFKINSRDINATPKIILAKYIKNMNFSSNNIGFDLELLIHLNKEKISWVEVPGYSERRKFGRSTTSIRSVWEMLLYMLRFYLKKYFKEC